jgi:hypothetical protein
MKNKIFYFLITLAVIGLIIFVVFLNSFGKKQNENTSFVIPTPATFHAVPGVPTRTPQQQQEDSNSFKVGLLSNLTPYGGKNFSLFYDLKKGQFTLYLNPLNKDTGNKEFDSFLKANGVLSRSWMGNFITTYALPSPTPGP